MTRKVTAPGPRKADMAATTRIAEIDEDITLYRRLMATAISRGQVAAAVAAAAKRTACERERANLRCTMAAAAERDPVRALEILRDAASAEGSWIASAQLERQVEAAIRERDAAAAAAAAAKETERRRDPARLVLQLQNALRALPDSMREEVLAPFRGPTGTVIEMPRARGKA